MKLQCLTLLLLVGCVGELEGDVSGEAFAARPSAALYPDLRTVVPQHLGWNKSNGMEVVRFSNGIANTGAGDLRLRPENHDGLTDAHQEILDAAGNVVVDQIVSTFFFHPQHNHWHIDNVALYEVRRGSPTGPLFGDGVKTTFCMIDWYALDGNSNTSDRIYWDCATSYQGIQTGWVDQYHQSTDGQFVNMTGAPAGDYYLVSTANHICTFLEEDCTNNDAWVHFALSRTKKGDGSITVLDHSPCENAGMCGEFAPNR